MKTFEQLTLKTQIAVEVFRKHVESNSDNELFIGKEIYPDNVKIYLVDTYSESLIYAYCEGFLGATGCSVQESIDGVCFCKTENFWLK